MSPPASPVPLYPWLPNSVGERLVRLSPPNTHLESCVFRLLHAELDAGRGLL